MYCTVRTRCNSLWLPGPGGTNRTTQTGCFIIIIIIILSEKQNDNLLRSRMPATQECLSPFVCIYKQIKVTQDNLPFGHALDPEGVKNSDETHVLVHLQPIKQRPGTKHACEQERNHRMGRSRTRKTGVSWSWQENKTKIIAYSTVVSKTSIPSSPHTNTTLLQNLSVNKTSRQPSTVQYSRHASPSVISRPVPSHYYWDPSFPPPPLTTPAASLPANPSHLLPAVSRGARGRGGSVPACWKGAR